MFLRQFGREVYCGGLETEFLFFIKMGETQKRGTLSEVKCWCKCTESGYTVSRPLFDNARYDFILDTGHSLLKIQIKSAH